MDILFSFVRQWRCQAQPMSTSMNASVQWEPLPTLWKRDPSGNNDYSFTISGKQKKLFWELCHNLMSTFQFSGDRWSNQLWMRIQEKWQSCSNTAKTEPRHCITICKLSHHTLTKQAFDKTVVKFVHNSNSKPFHVSIM